MSVVAMFDVDWTDSLRYDLVINTGGAGVTAAVGQVLGLAAAPEFQPTMASRRLVADRSEVKVFRRPVR